jgi:hypothetical protein
MWVIGDEVWKLRLALVFIAKNIYFGFFSSLVSTELAQCLSQFSLCVNQGFLSFSKQDFRTGSYRPRFSDRRLEIPEFGRPVGLKEIAFEMEPDVILTLS